MADALAIILGAIGGLFFIGCLCCCGDPCCDPEYGTPVRRSSVSSSNRRFNKQVNTEVVSSNETNGHVTQVTGDTNGNTDGRTEEFERTENL